MLFNDPLEPIDWGSEEGVGVFDALTSCWGWHTWERREQRGFFAEWKSFQVGEGSRNATIRMQSNVLGDQLQVIGPTGSSYSLCESASSEESFSRYHIRFYSDIQLGTHFACPSVPIPTPTLAVVGDNSSSEAAIDRAVKSLPAGAVLLGCGLKDRKLATFELMEDS